MKYNMELKMAFALDPKREPFVISLLEYPVVEQKGDMLFVCYKTGKEQNDCYLQEVIYVPMSLGPIVEITRPEETPDGGKTLMEVFAGEDAEEANDRIANEMADEEARKFIHGDDKCCTGQGIPGHMCPSAFDVAMAKKKKEGKP